MGESDHRTARGTAGSRRRHGPGKRADREAPNWRSLRRAAGLAVFHAMCGEHDRAVEWAGRAIEERHPLLVRALRPLLTVQQWSPLARKMNLS
jgi:hypothetical protein